MGPGVREFCIPSFVTGMEVVPLNRTLLTGLVIGVLAGFFLGYFAGSSAFRSTPTLAVQAAPAAPAAGAPIPSALNQLESQQRIASAEAALAADPKNVQGWVLLGNDYFDLHQHQKAVDAYAKALALDPKGPGAADVLTDQGVMYLDLKAVDKAIANFKLASKLNPKHQHSLFNLGIAYSQYKQDPAAALQAWKKVLEIDPGTPTAQQARDSIAGLQGQRPIK